MQETAPTEGGLLTADKTTAVDVEGAWRWAQKFTTSLLLYVQQGEYTEHPLVADDVPRRRYRALVVASLRCGAARIVRPRAVFAGDHTSKGCRNNLRCERLL